MINELRHYGEIEQESIYMEFISCAGPIPCCLRQTRDAKTEMNQTRRHNVGKWNGLSKLEFIPHLRYTRATTRKWDPEAHQQDFYFIKRFHRCISFTAETRKQSRCHCHRHLRIICSWDMRQQFKAGFHRPTWSFYSSGKWLQLTRLSLKVFHLERAKVEEQPMRARGSRRRDTCPPILRFVFHSDVSESHNHDLHKVKAPKKLCKTLNQ